MRPLFYKFFIFPFIFLFFWGAISCGGSGGNSSADLNLSAQNCGNALLNAGEACDDGNVNNSDGCNAHCAFEVGESICGNGVLENDECCDDGNNVNGDGCSADCILEVSNHSPSAPLLAEQPASGVIWAPTRLYLSWNPSSDSDVGDQIVYDVYFTKENVAPAVPYKKGITDTHFIIQASTDNRTKYFPDEVSPIYLSPPSDHFDGQYIWKVCARDQHGAQSCSESRVFRTDDSVVGWWRFDEDPSQPSECEGEDPSSSNKKICDYSGKGNHGIAYGMPERMSLLEIENNELLGNGLKVDGIDDGIMVPNTSEFNVTDSLSMSCKLRLSGRVNTLSSIFTKDSPGGQPFGFYQYLDEIEFAIYSRTNGLGNIFANMRNYYGTFLRITGVYNGSDNTLKFFINDNLYAQLTHQGGISNYTNNITIGYSDYPDPYVDDYINSMFDECLIVVRPFDDNEIVNFYKTDR